MPKGFIRPIMKRLFLFLISGSIISGCTFYVKPKKELEFFAIKKLAELNGIYKNKGNPKGYLSTLFFKRLPAEDILYIQVKTTNDTINLSAIDKNCKTYTKQYINKKDFQIKEGKITIKEEFHLLSRGGDDPLVGPSYEKIVLGLDKNSDAAYKTKVRGAGLIYLFFPAAFSSDEDLRFQKLSTLPKLSTCKNSNPFND